MAGGAVEGEGWVFRLVFMRDGSGDEVEEEMAEAASRRTSGWESCFVYHTSTATAG